MNEFFIIYLAIILAPGLKYSMYLLLNKPRWFYMPSWRVVLSNLDRMNRNWAGRVSVVQCLFTKATDRHQTYPTYRGDFFFFFLRFNNNQCLINSYLYCYHRIWYACLHEQWCLWEEWDDWWLYLFGRKNWMLKRKKDNTTTQN